MSLVDQIERFRAALGDDILQAIVKFDQTIKKLETENKRLRECLSEAIDLVESVRTGEYKPDSFTTQPWKKAMR